MKKEAIVKTIVKAFQNTEDILNVFYDETSEALIIQTEKDERFRINATPLGNDGNDKELQIYKNYFSVTAGMALMQMKNQNILSLEEFQEIWSRI